MAYLRPAPGPRKPPTRWNRFAFWLLRPRKEWLWHQDSPGMRVLVVRTWIGRLIFRSKFNRIGEDTYEDGPHLPPLHTRKKSPFDLEQP